MLVALGNSSYVSCAWAHKRGYALELYLLTAVQKFSTAVFEVPGDDRIGRNVQSTSDVKNDLNLKNMNFNILTQVECETVT
jgi:hypothetical protein